MGLATAPGKAMPRVPLRHGEGNKDHPTSFGGLAALSLDAGCPAAALDRSFATRRAPSGGPPPGRPAAARPGRPSRPTGVSQQQGKDLADGRLPGAGLG